jgi:predicted esterase YcpF (UPF0227 family)
MLSFLLVILALIIIVNLGAAVFICPISFVNKDTEYKFINNKSKYLMIVFPGNNSTHSDFINYLSKLFFPTTMIDYSCDIIKKYINNYAEDHIIIYGFSLGGLFAVNVTDKLKLKNCTLIVDKTFKNLSLIIGKILGIEDSFAYYVAYNWCKFDNLKIKNMKLKNIYVINSTNDSVIPLDISLASYCNNIPNITCISSTLGHNDNKTDEINKILDTLLT